MSNFRIYNDTLCPDLWDSAQHLDPKIRVNLLQIANDFYEKTKLPAPVIDAYLMGSIANYNWTPDSDVDIHIMVDYNSLKMPPETALKIVKIVGTQWNLEHTITIKNHKVEVNLQDIHEVKPHVTGVYSLVKDQWVRKPQKQPPVIDKSIIMVQYQAMKKYIESGLNSNNRDVMKSVKEYIDAYRQYGLDHGGELSYQNIVFKILRAKGIIKKLKDSITATYDKEMSVDENSSATYGPNARFGLGAIDSNDAVIFKEFSRDIFANQAHGRGGNPWGRSRFRYFDGVVEWSDSRYPTKEQQHLVDTYLEKRGFPVKKHTSIYDDTWRENDDTDISEYKKYSTDEIKIGYDHLSSVDNPPSIQSSIDNIDFSKLSLDNLYSMLTKNGSEIRNLKRKNYPAEAIKEKYLLADKLIAEIRRRLLYINAPRKRLSNHNIKEYKKYSVDSTDPVVAGLKGSDEESWRGPHQDIELKLMLMGKKPAALADFPEEFKEYIKAGTFISGKSKKGRFVVALPNEKWRLDKIISLLNKFGEADKARSQGKSLQTFIGNKKLKLYHIALGRLLGYSKYDVEKFVDAQGLDESYYDKYNSDEKHKSALDYFSIGQEHEEETAKSYCWLWNKATQSIDAKKGGTHSTNFGHTAKEYTYSGWFDPFKNKISFVFPESELRKFGDRQPTKDDIPQQVYQKLMNKFGKNKPDIIVF